MFVRKRLSIVRQKFILWIVVRMKMLNIIWLNGFSHINQLIILHIIGITSTKNLNSFEISKFNINNSNLPINVLIGNHLEQNYAKFNSKSYFSLNTTYVKLDINDYLFGYGNPSDFSFGKNYN